jgi:hypothetical protein
MTLQIARRAGTWIANCTVLEALAAEQSAENALFTEKNIKNCHGIVPARRKRRVRSSSRKQIAHIEFLIATI